MFQGQSKPPRFKAGGSVHASTVPISKQPLPGASSPFSSAVTTSGPSPLSLGSHGQQSRAQASPSSKIDQPYSAGFALSPSTLFHVKQVQASTTDRESHRYTLQLAEPETVSFEVEQSQLIPAAPFQIGQVVRWKKDGDLYEVVGREISLNQAQQGINRADPGTADTGRRSAMTPDKSKPQISAYASIKSQQEKDAAVVVLTIADEIGTKCKVEVGELEPVSNEEAKNFQPG